MNKIFDIDKYPNEVDAEVMAANSVAHDNDPSITFHQPVDEVPTAVQSVEFKLDEDTYDDLLITTDPKLLKVKLVDNIGGHYGLTWQSKNGLGGIDTMHMAVLGKDDVFHLRHFCKIVDRLSIYSSSYTEVNTPIE
jgi:hypothetical protein